MGTFPVRFPSAVDPGDAGWHIDVSFGTDTPDFMSWRANIYSKGRALLMLFLFSDVGELDAPTRIRVGSHADIARQLAPAGFLVGRSVHTRSEALAAAHSGVDYLVAGTVYPTASKAQGSPLLGLAGLGELVRAVAVPVLAIGGVVADKMGDIAASGAAGVAAIGLFANVPTDANDAHFDRALQELVARLRAPFEREPACG